MKISRQTHQKLGGMVNRFMSAMHRYDAGRTLPLLHTAKLTTPQVALLELVREPQTMSAAAKHLGLSLPATSQLVDKLVRRHLILRKEGAADRRQRFVFLSAQGEGLVASIAEARAARFGSSLAVLPRGIATRFESILAEVVNALEEWVPDDETQIKAPHPGRETQ